MMGAVLNFPRLRDTCPEDLLWQSPGTPETRRPIDAELVEVTPPEQWRATPADGGGGKLWLVNLGLLLLATFLAGCLTGAYSVVLTMAEVL